jgi:predicted DNA-binding protein (MmcQ/YjbR family)
MMNIEDIREYCLLKLQVTETFPFDESTLVFKVAGKMFLLCGLDGVPLSLNLKCDPERAIALRAEFDCIIPGYHMNKTHWNTVILDETLPNELLVELIDHSYDLVVNSLPKAVRLTFE